MATISKTQGIAILAHQAVMHPGTVVGSAQDVSTKLAAKITLFHASVEGVINTNPGRFLVQTSASATGDEDWSSDYEFDATISTADTETISGAEAAGQTVIEVANTSGFASRDKLYIQDTSVVADGEWNFCSRIVGATSIDLVSGLTNPKDNVDVVWNDADIFTCWMDLTAVTRLRVVFLHQGTAGVNCHIKGLMVTGDSIA